MASSFLWKNNSIILSSSNVFTFGLYWALTHIDGTHNQYLTLMISFFEKVVDFSN